MTDARRIPLQVDVSRIIEVLASQIYQSPLALLRENTQNAFDAVVIRRQTGDAFEPRIDVSVQPDVITIADNGIGMTPDDLEHHFWRAGASSKNTPEARAAGVVGTFGIGAMANFGIANRLVVETESAASGERTRSSADRDTLSAVDDSIDVVPLESRGEAGTVVTAYMEPDHMIQVDEALEYIREFVSYVGIPVFVNDELVSNNDIHTAIRPAQGADIATVGPELSRELRGSLEIAVTQAGEVWLRLSEASLSGTPIDGVIALRQGANSLRTFRNGFGLAVVSVQSRFGFGGVADARALEPTAGREALTTGSMQLLQSTVTALDQTVSEWLSGRPESDLNTAFMDWSRRHGRYELCGELRMRLEPGGDRVPLRELCQISKETPLLLYSGSDQSLIDAVASDDSRLAVLAGQQPRRQCEEQYLRRLCTVEDVSDTPQILSTKPRQEWTLAEKALAFRLVSILENDYFLSTEVELGKLSHDLPLLVDEVHDPVLIVFDPEAPTFALILELYRSEHQTFVSMTKDFVRNSVFQKVKHLVPSSTREGAEAFLQTIRRTRDVFEYERADLDSLSAVWEEYLEGRLSMAQAAARSTRIVTRNVQVVDRASAQLARDVVPDVVSNEASLSGGGEDYTGPAPSIMRPEVESEAKLLMIDESEVPIRGYRHFLALSDRAREERGEFFFQPHSTSVVWGGQKVLFVFEHHSGEFGLYYDLQTPGVVAAESGGGPYPTATLVLGNRIYIPLPEAIGPEFVPAAGERKRLEVRSDLLFIDAAVSDEPIR